MFLSSGMTRSKRKLNIFLRLYCATHCSGPPINHAVWRPWHTWDDSENMHSGFHIFSFDPETENLVDFGIMSPNEGSRAMALAEKRGLLYGITWPRDHFYVFDIRNRKYRNLGPHFYVDIFV